MDNLTVKKDDSVNALLGIFGIFRLKLHDLAYIVYRNLFLLTNGVIFSVVILLFVFGDRRAALFLGIISVFNVLAGLIQDINAWLALEKLQLLTAPRVTRISQDGSSESVLVEKIVKGDRIRLKIGDQVPSDSVLVEAQSFEINEGLITGESDSIPKNAGDHLLAGSVVTSGSGLIMTETVFHESRIARMTEGIKKYSINLSPIQRSINGVVKYAGFLLLAVIAFIIARGLFLHESKILIVNNIGAIANVLVPAGLVFAATLIFAYGAAHLFRRQVLLQEVNATEKLGRIKNLCMDKTGTLTENILSVESMHVPPRSSADFAKKMTAAYIQGTGDTSQTIEAVKRFLPDMSYSGKILQTLSFSSWRQYGAVKVQSNSGQENILVGSSDIFLQHIGSDAEKKWLREIMDKEVSSGKRILCVMQAPDDADLGRNIPDAKYSVLAVFVFFNNLRPGIKKAIDFFQQRGVRIRIISGDNPETVRAISSLAGIKNTDKIITGKEMAGWEKADFDEKVKQYTVFARIVPEQKEKIIDALRKDGFTAMIGDGANDALAIKKADLGIAMFEGAPATRQLASVVLMNNSFTALPGGVELADSVIRSLENFSSIFFNMSFVGTFFFVFISILGYAYPLTPLNMAFINYISIGLPGVLITYWVIFPSGTARPSGDKTFLQQTLPFASLSALIQALGLTLVFLLSPELLRKSASDFPVLMAFIASGFVFTICAARTYTGTLTVAQKKQLWLLGAIELLILVAAAQVPILSDFFNIFQTQLSLAEITGMTIIVGLSCLAQLKLTNWFLRQNRKTT